ncbi:MAG: hypothetical protein HY719_15260 [Planctomycetes bacterium]|nr:hypothetical protein [Planctomycetota bacterium]
MIVAFAANGCALMEAEKPKPVVADYMVANTVLDQGSEARQAKDGVTVTVTPLPFTAKEFVKTTLVEKEGRTPDGRMIVEKTETPSIRLEPVDLTFKVKITNQMERVLKMAGAIVAFSVNGKQAAIPQGNYADMLGGIIRSRQEMEFDVKGPKIADLPDNTNLAFSIEDIVVETDAASNPTKRANFEWVYVVTKKKDSKTLGPATSDTYYVPPALWPQMQAEAKATSGE